jgi:hypothetical protein
MRALSGAAAADGRGRLREKGWENERTITVKRDKIGRPLAHP